MSSYEDRMAEKYNFLKKDESENNVQKEEVSSEDKITNDVVPDENQEKDSLLVPLDAWNTVLNQLGNLHESSQLMAEARERAAKAEAEADFLREKLKNTRQQLDDAQKKKRFFFF
ncbi:MAG: hypothetical protein ACR2L5_00435 [Candidatus Actinomarinaceae bacterium]|jgi:hypothetical protein|tara:strand:- start:21 stop:365 length:345 start_codon:yes stop_codon:yes gene_type:complete